MKEVCFLHTHTHLSADSSVAFSLLENGTVDVLAD